jgi:hypothetical protein
VEYGRRGDALHIAFSPDTVANDSELTDNDVLVRYRGNKIISLTILHFSERQKKSSGRKLVSSTDSRRLLEASYGLNKRASMAPGWNLNPRSFCAWLDEHEMFIIGWAFRG